MSEMFDGAISSWKEQIDAELKNLIKYTKYANEFKSVLEYALFPGGKRLRPVLMLLWHELFLPANECALRYACGIELLHSYSLIHDDMPCMDNDDTRRGKPSVHKKYGEGMALLAGDALLDLAMSVMSSPLPDGSSSPFCSLFTLCGDCGLISGQYYDLFGNIDNLEDLLNMYDKKTGALIKLACVGGYALGSNTDPKSIELRFGVDQTNDLIADLVLMQKDTSQNVMWGVYAKSFGAHFGRAFQIYDDLSEYIDGKAITGTSVLNFIDLDDGKRLLNSELDMALGELNELPGDTRLLKELVEKFIIV